MTGSATSDVEETPKACIKGPWTVEEDVVLEAYVSEHGEGQWNLVQRNTGLRRCGKSCRLRWANHLRPDLKKGVVTAEEEAFIVGMHAQFGNKWAKMAAQLPGRTDNEIKNFWNTRAKRRMRAGLPLHSEGDATCSPLLYDQNREPCAASPFTTSSRLSRGSNQSSVLFVPPFAERPTNRCTSSPPRKALRTSLNCTPSSSSVALAPMADLGAINQLFSTHPPGSSSWGGAKPDLIGRQSEVVEGWIGGHAPLSAMTRSLSCISTSGMTPTALTPISRHVPESSLGVKRLSPGGRENEAPGGDGGATRSRIQRLKRARDQALADAASEARTPECASYGAMHHPALAFVNLPHTQEHGGEPEVDGGGDGWVAGAGRDLMKLLDNGPAVGQQNRSQIVPCLVEMPEFSEPTLPKTQNPPPPMELDLGRPYSSPYLSDYLRDLNPLGRGSSITHKGRFPRADPDGLSPTDPFALDFLESPYAHGSESDQTLLETMLQEERQAGMQQTGTHVSPTADVVTPKSEFLSRNNKDEFIETLFEEQGAPGMFPRFTACRQISLLTPDDWMDAYGSSQQKTDSS